MKKTIRLICEAIMLCLLLFVYLSCSKKAYSDNAPAATSTPPATTQHDSLAYSVNIVGNGANGYASYRIPAIIKTPDGGLLAFMEGRVNSSADFGNIKILAQKSMDNGKHWGTAAVVAQNGNIQADNAAPVTIPRPMLHSWLA